MKKFFANPTVRLAGRALAAAALTAAFQIEQQAPGTIAWRAIAVGAGLAFLEVFTPLNALIGPFKQLVAKKGAK